MYACVMCCIVFVDYRACPLHYRKRLTAVRVTLLSENMAKPAAVVQRKIQYSYVGTRTRFSHY